MPRTRKSKKVPSLEERRAKWLSATPLNPLRLYIHTDRVANPRVSTPSPDTSSDESGYSDDLNKPTERVEGYEKNRE